MPCVIYAAKSTTDPRGSIPDQRRECRDAIERETGREVVAEYVDEAFSASRQSRGPGLVDAMQHAEDLAEESGSVPRIGG
jgi:Resolvase, N terminal domain